MSDSVFRTKVVEPAASTTQEKHDEPTRSGSEGKPIEVPYLDYSKEHHHPYPVDYFKLGNRWDSPEGGFFDEVSLIEEYFEKEIRTGEMSNSLESVKERLAEMETIHKIDKETRTAIKIPMLAAYVKFLKDTNKIKNKFKKNMRKQYGSN